MMNETWRGEVLIVVGAMPAGLKFTAHDLAYEVKALNIPVVATEPPPCAVGRVLTEARKMGLVKRTNKWTRRRLHDGGSTPDGARNIWVRTDMNFDDVAMPKPRLKEAALALAKRLSEPESEAKPNGSAHASIP